MVVCQVGVDEGKCLEVRTLLQKSDQLVGCLGSDLAVNYPQVLQVVLSERPEKDRLELPNRLLAQFVLAVDDLRQSFQLRDPSHQLGKVSVNHPAVV